jgi:GNAT superfamily N-acetyltransferase
LAPDASIRVASEGDAEAVAGLIAAFVHFYGEDEPGDAAILSVVRRLLADEQTEFLLAGEPPVGLAQLRFRLSAWTGADDAWLEDVFVVEEARNTGIGRLLTEACIERARGRGCRRIQLDANEKNERALALYESLGFSCAKPGRWDGGRDLYLTKWLDD